LFKLWNDKKIAEAVKIKDADFKSERVGIELKVTECKKRYIHNNNRVIVMDLFIDFEPDTRKLAR
tara:strand:+ start:14767 stop:14961 length:195 start_codon:yes stop_codon:yes gene_type:complete